jgi:predicted transcriptional regulator
MVNGITVGALVAAIEGELVCGEDKLDRVLDGFVASDLLSDVLAGEKENYALLTGLTNAQIVRTAEITNACCVVIVGNKQPQQAAVALAKRSGIPLILAPCSMFDACCRVGRCLETNDGGPKGTPNTPGT